MQSCWRPTIVMLLLTGVAFAEEPLFSGPQRGEPLPPLAAQQAFGESANIDALAGTAEAPLVIVFVHQVTRPSIGLTRLLMEYAATKADAGLRSRLVFLTDDVTDATAMLSRARHALPRGSEPLISTDGIEGPGAYGLNRKMTLTVLVANKGVVTANFPLVQPSVQADAPRIGHAIVQALGGSGAPTLEAPTLEEMGYREPPMAMRAAGQSPERDAEYRRLMAPVIQKSASPEEVDTAARAVEAFAAENPWFRRRVHTASRMITGGPRLSDYGTPEAQAYLKKWAVDLAPEEAGSSDNSERRTNQADGTDAPTQDE